jgi:hypothetical protein
MNSIVDFNPIPIGVLKINLSDTILSKIVFVGGVSPVRVRDL